MHATWRWRATRRILAWGSVAASLALGGLAGCGEEKPQAVPALQQTGETVRVRHILVQFKSAQGATAEVTRSRAEADSLVRALAARLEAGEDFAALAREYSDDASRTEGGEIAPIQPGDVPAEFERVARATQPGQVSAPFESPYGFHILVRLGLEPIAAQHILFQFAGAQGAPDTLHRTRVEALELAERVLAELQNPLTSFPVAAATYSDDESNFNRGGYLGVFIRGKMHPAFEAAAFALAENQISGVVETPFGFHIIRRVPIGTIRVGHILFRFAGTDGFETTLATEDQALKKAMDALFRARNGEDFAALALEYSEDKATASKGGRLHRLDRGQTVPEFEEVAFSLAPGQISDVVKTQFGFHIIKRFD